MEANSFYFGAYWGPRAETLTQVQNKVTHTLRILSDSDDQFQNWYEPGKDLNAALLNKIEINEERIKELCLQRVKKGELNEEGFIKMGFGFTLWSGHSDPYARTITFNVGSASKWVMNSCVIKVPTQGEAKERLLNIENAKKILLLIVQIWAPDYAVLTSHELSNQLGVGNKIGWITYQNRIKQEPKPYPGINYENTELGFWFYPNDIREEGLIDSLSQMVNIVG